MIITLLITLVITLIITLIITLRSVMIITLITLIITQRRECNYVCNELHHLMGVTPGVTICVPLRCTTAIAIAPVLSWTVFPYSRVCGPAQAASQNRSRAYPNASPDCIWHANPRSDLQSAEDKPG